MKRWWALALLVLLVGTASYFAIQRYRYRLVRSDDDLFALLPRQEATIFFADVKLLRQNGLLTLLAPTKTLEDRDYARFVQQTGFDWMRDLDALAGTSAAGQTVLAARGRFDWSRIAEYAGTSGGNCHGSNCTVPVNAAHRSLSLTRIQPDVLALTVGGAAVAPGPLRSVHSAGAVGMVSHAPVWLRPARTVLDNPSGLPLPARIFAISLQSADSLLLTLEPPSQDGEGVVFDIDLYATFPNGPAADTARQQLQSSTRLLKETLATAHKPQSVSPDPGSLEWLLTAGTFEGSGKQVDGRWPVRRELLNSLLR